MRFTKKAIEECCVPPPPGAVNGKGKPLLQLIYWDDEIPSLGLCVGKSAKSFFLQKKVRGRSHKIRIGRWPSWTVDDARRRAREIIVGLEKGHTQGRLRLTLKDATDEHVAAMRASGCTERTIREFPEDMQRNAAAWWNLPIADVTKEECRKLHRRLTASSGPYAANRALQAFRAVWNTVADVYDNMPPNPVTKKFPWNKESRRREPIPWAALPDWRKKVEALSPVRRDFQYFVLFTGLRSSDAATVRWQYVDFAKGTLHLPCPKGGADRAFTIPLAAAALDILKRRQGEDDEWAFTSVRGGPLIERRMQGARTAKTPKEPTPHRLRDTYLTAARECGVDLYDQKTLVNHALPMGDVTVEYTRPSLEHLRACAERIVNFILSKFDGPKTP